MWHDIKMLNVTTNALVGLCLLALVASGLWWLAQRPMFALQVITVHGTDQATLRHANALTIKNSAVPHIRGNFFTVDLSEVRAAFENVPWVRRATVRREWPNRLRVSLEEYQVLGTWGEDGQLLSTRGDVFTANLAEAEEDGMLRSFNGPKGSEKEVVTRFQDMRAWLAPIKLIPVAVSLSERFAWSIKLNNGMTVKFGREQKGRTLKALVARMARVYPQLLGGVEGRIQRMDLRYPNGLALAVSSTGANMKVNSNKHGI